MFSKSADCDQKKYNTALIFKAWFLYKKSAPCKVLKLSLDETNWFNET